MIRWTVAVLMFSVGMARAIERYNQPVQSVAGLQGIVDVAPACQEFVDVMATVFTLLDDVEVALVGQENNTELRGLRRFKRECVKAKDEKNLDLMLAVLDGMRDLYKRLTTVPMPVRLSLSAVIGDLESFTVPESCVWREALGAITNDVHEFIDSLALMVPLSMTAELQELTEKVTDLLAVGTLEAFAECVAALRRLPTLLNNGGLRQEVEVKVSQLLGRLLRVPVALNPHEVVHCVCGACE